MYCIIDSRKIKIPFLCLTVVEVLQRKGLGIYLVSKEKGNADSELHNYVSCSKAERLFINKKRDKLILREVIEGGTNLVPKVSLFDLVRSIASLGTKYIDSQGLIVEYKDGSISSLCDDAVILWKRKPCSKSLAVRIGLSMGVNFSVLCWTSDPENAILVYEDGDSIKLPDGDINVGHYDSFSLEYTTPYDRSDHGSIINRYSSIIKNIMSSRAPSPLALTVFSKTVSRLLESSIELAKELCMDRACRIQFPCVNNDGPIEKLQRYISCCPVLGYSPAASCSSRYTFGSALEIGTRDSLVINSLVPASGSMLEAEGLPYPEDIPYAASVIGLSMNPKKNKGYSSRRSNRGISNSLKKYISQVIDNINIQDLLEEMKVEAEAQPDRILVDKDGVISPCNGSLIDRRRTDRRCLPRIC